MSDTRYADSPRQSRIAAAVLFLVVIGSAPSAFAVGLVTFDEAGVATGLGELSDLNVEISLTEDLATIVETRTYGIEATELDRTVRFYRGLGLDADAGSVRLSIGGQTVAVESSSADAGRARRATLLRELRAPGVLRGFDDRLAESDPVVLDAGYQRVEVRVELRVALTRWDTMRGLQVPIDWHERAVGSMSLVVDATTDAPLRALYSPFHGIDVVRRDEHGASAAYHGYQVCTTNDLVILLSTGSEDIHLDVLPFRYSNAEAGFFMALFTPSRSAAVAPRDFVFLIDSSGSMEGEKMEQAQTALHSVIAGLSPKDRFTIVDFDSRAKPLTDDARPASPEFVDEAADFVTALVAGGATNLSEALSLGFDALPFTQDRPRYIVLLTDGQPTEGEKDTEAILDLVRLRNEVGARVFAFGIGNDVNTVLLDRLAIDSGGDAIYIRPMQSVVGPVETFFDSIASASLVDPVLDVSFGGVPALFPDQLPDLFAQQTVAVVGRYERGGVGQIALRGRRGADEVVKTFDVQLPEYTTRNDHVPRIWATRYLGALLQRIKLGDADPELPLEATALARRFGVVTEFTNFVVDEEGHANMQYTAVPLDVSGSVAVDTSASLDGYQNTGSAALQFDNFVRYAADRTLPIFDGWYRDTSLPSAPAWTDLRFGSPRFMDLVRTESTLGVTTLLAVGRDVAFELHGRAFRVSDTEADRTTPPESAQIPPAILPAPPSHATVDIIEDTATPAPPSPSAPSSHDTPPPAQLTGRGCATATPATPTHLCLLALLAAFLLRRRNRPTVGARPASMRLARRRPTAPGAISRRESRRGRIE